MGRILSKIKNVKCFLQYHYTHPCLCIKITHKCASPALSKIKIDLRKKTDSSFRPNNKCCRRHFASRSVQGLIVFSNPPS